MDTVRRFTAEERRRACRLLEHERPPVEGDCDECAEYRVALCHFPAWLTYPARDPADRDPDR